MKTMAEVIEDAAYTHQMGLFDADVKKLADALTAAGFGPVKAAQAGALRDAADELAQLPYVKPGVPGRAEYEMVLAVRRGMADAWLRNRAASIEADQ